MKKLEFMVGKWAGEARLLRGPGGPVLLMQTEEAQYKLDGLILLIEGVGRTKADGKSALQALGIVSYDDESGTYRMRAFNDGRFLETELKLLDSGKGMTWGFALGQIRTSCRFASRWLTLRPPWIQGRCAKKVFEERNLPLRILRRLCCIRDSQTCKRSLDQGTELSGV
jgi:hypothetical protein